MASVARSLGVEKDTSRLWRTLSLLLSLTPSMRSVNTAWLRLLCSLSWVQPTVRFSIARASRSSTSW